MQGTLFSWAALETPRSLLLRQTNPHIIWTTTNDHHAGSYVDCWCVSNPQLSSKHIFPSTRYCIVLSWTSYPHMSTRYNRSQSLDLAPERFVSLYNHSVPPSRDNLYDLNWFTLNETVVNVWYWYFILSIAPTSSPSYLYCTLIKSLFY